jgi:hypothetical protein
MTCARRFASVLACSVLTQIAFLQESTANGGRDSLRDALLSDIRSQDVEQVVETLNEIKQEPQQESLLPLVSDLWANRTKAHPELPWTFVGQDRIRLELADILIQAKVNDAPIPEFKDIHAYVRSMLNDKNPELSRKAIVALGLLDDEDDAICIAKIAREENPRTFRAAVLTLSTMCNANATKALDELANVTSGENREYVGTAVDKSDRMKRGTRWCGSSMTESPE